MSERSDKTGRLTNIRWLGFIPQLFFLILLPLTVLVLVIALVSVSLHQKAMRDMAGEQDLRTVRANAQVIEQALQYRITGLQFLAQRVDDGVSQQTVLDEAGDLSAAFDAGLAFGDADGTLIADKAAPSGQRITPSQFSALVSGLQEASGAATITTSNAQDGSPLVLMGYRNDQGHTIAGAFTPRSIAVQALGGMDSTEMLVTLMDGSGLVLYQSGSMGTPPDLSSHPGYVDAVHGESGITYVKDNGIEQVVAFSPVESPGWALVIEQPWQAMASPLLRTTQMAPLVLIPALLLMLVGLWFGLRQIIQPLKALEGQANAMAWKNFSAIQTPVGGIAEIQQLQATLMEMARRVQAAQENLRSYIGAITRGQEDERRRLAREIHDDTLQSIVALNQRVQLTRLDLGDHPARASLDEIQGLTEQTIGNLRRLVRALRPSYLEELGLPAALEMMAKETAQATGYPVNFNCSGDERRLPTEVELTLYRMTQESLNNAVYHAEPKQVTVDVTYTPQHARISIRDDGRGFKIPENPGEFAPAGHFGLLGLYERAELAGADLTLRSTPGAGTTVEIVYPCGGATTSAGED